MMKEIIGPQRSKSPIGTSAMEKTQMIKMEQAKLKHEFTPEKTPNNRVMIESKHLAATKPSTL